MSTTMDMLWTGALAAIPLAIVVAIVCRWKATRPTTRHLLWLAVLASFVAPVFAGLVRTPDWFSSGTVLAKLDAWWPVESVEYPSPLLPEVPRTNVPRTNPNAPTPSRELDPRIGPADLGLSRDTTVPSDSHAISRLGSREVQPGTSLPFEEVSGIPLASAALFEKPSAGFSPGAYPGASTPMESRAVSIRPETPTPLPPTTPLVLSLKPVESSWAQARGWVAGLLALRDAIASLPPIPTAIWLGGAVLVLMCGIARTLWTARWIARSLSADPHTRAMVRELAEEIRLTRVPETVFVDQFVSPLIWCGIKPRLVLPVELWRSLDDASRRAVIVHELAHLKRRDHRVCWVEFVIGALYWWHPVVWWARRRVHEEAESACDAWVTGLLPASRRAYATALLATKSFVSARTVVAGPWLGVWSGPARRLSRRITMVMTERASLVPSRPRTSTIGVCVAALVLGAGAFVTPGLACPPEESAKSEGGKVKVTKGSGQTPHVIIRRGVPAAEGGDIQFFGEAPALEAMKQRGEVHVATPKPPKPPKTPKPPKAPRPARSPDAPMTLFVPVAPDGSGQNHSHQAPASGATALGMAIAGPQEGTVPRDYKLPERKLQAMWELMRPNDVPIFVSMGDGAITVNATPAQHETFAAFVVLIHPDGAKGSAGGATSTTEARTLLSRVLAERGAAAGATNAQDRARVERDAAAQYRDAFRKIEREREQMNREVERWRSQSEKQQDQAERLAELAQDLGHRTGDIEASERAMVEATAQRLRTRADDLRTQSRTLESRIEQIEREMEKLQERAAQIEEQIAQLDESEDTDSDTDLTKLALPMILEIEDAVPADVQAPAEPTPASDGADGTPVVPAIAPAPPVTPVPPVGTAPGAR